MARTKQTARKNSRRQEGGYLSEANEKGDIRILLRRGWRPASTRRGAGEAKAGEEENYPHPTNQANQCDVDCKLPSVFHPAWDEPSPEKSVRVEAMDR